MLMTVSDTSATNCGITISGNQTIDIDSSICTWKMNEELISLTVQIHSPSMVISLSTSSVMRCGLMIVTSPASNNVINMTGNISTISTGGAERMHGIRI